MKRASPTDGMLMLQSYDTSSDSLAPLTEYAAMDQQLQSKRPCYPGEESCNHVGMFNQQVAAPAAGGVGAHRRCTPFSMHQQLPSMPNPVLPVLPTSCVRDTAHLAAAQLVAAGPPQLCMPNRSPPDMVDPHLRQVQQSGQLLPSAPYPMQGSTTSSTTAAGAASAAPGSLLEEVRHQAARQLQQQQATQQPSLHAPDRWHLRNDLQRLLPRLNQEYKREMQLLLRACQVACNVTRNSISAAPTGGVLLDPAAREHVQHQVLSNCNDKHSAVIAAFRVAAQAVAAAAAASSIATGSRRSANAAAAAAVEILGSGDGTAVDDAEGRTGSHGEAAPEAVAEALHQLRSSYHQELVAATSALFAICRGFGQSSTMAAATSQPIKTALAAAQQQHVQVEQLWQDVLLVAARGPE